MSRDRNKEQTYYKVKVWFKHRTKLYTIHTYDKLLEFLDKADANETIVFYMVESYSVFVYPEYMGNRFKKRRTNDE